MESMIKIDNGVSKKAMEEIAEVAITLFEASNTHGVSQRNLGKVIGLLGKSIRTGSVSIAHCNLTTTVPEHYKGSTAGMSVVAPPYPACTPSINTDDPQSDGKDPDDDQEG